MSGKLTLKFNVENMSIMQETLKRLNYQFEKNKNGLTIKRHYLPITISENDITCDTMDDGIVSEIKSQYQKDFQIYERTIRGESFEVSETKNEIVITVY